jgi:quinoprotein glucose dehydrogenase
MRALHHKALVIALFALSAPTSLRAAEATTDVHQTGMRYSPLAQINASNVKDLAPAWEYHTGETDNSKSSLDVFEDQPSMIEGNLVVCTTSRRLIALDPSTGKERWIFDPKSNAGKGPRKCRGISAWVDDQAAADAVCKTRIFLGTADNRLVAVDGKTGAPCQSFGVNGEVQIKSDKPDLYPGEMAIVSRPAIVNGVVVVGSSIGDSVRQNNPSGKVRAFDARTGEPKWEFDPIPRTPDSPAAATWLRGVNNDIGGANVWAPMAVDESLDLVYLPTTEPSLDYYGGNRPGNNLYANSIVAVKGATGEVAWHFQFTHHDIWDFDTPSQPMLIDWPRGNEKVPALVQNLKTGLIFAFNRKTGEPLLPVEERPVPQDGAVPGEWLSPTQPFPTGIDALGPLSMGPEDAWGFTPIDKWVCKRQIEELRHGPIYTPMSEQGTVMQPSAVGGANWGGGAYDPQSHIMVVASARIPMVFQLIPRDKGSIPKDQGVESTKPMVWNNEGSPYLLKMYPLLSKVTGAPCTTPPWTALVGIDMVTGKMQWQVPLGSIEKLTPVPLPFEWELGTPGGGSPLVTAGGLAFIGYTMDNKFRAFDVQTGKKLWTGKIPAGGMSSPVTYEANGEQFVVLTAGGHFMYRSTKGDAVVAFKLKK